jgi:hypothetical protein
MRNNNTRLQSIAFYNLENFYDTVDNPIVNDDDFTPKGAKNYNGKIYRDKVEHSRFSSCADREQM